MARAVSFTIARSAYIRARTFIAGAQDLSEAERRAACIRMRRIIAGLVRDGKQDSTEISNSAIGEIRQAQQIQRSRRSLLERANQ